MPIRINQWWKRKLYPCITPSDMPIWIWNRHSRRLCPNSPTFIFTSNSIHITSSFMLRWFSFRWGRRMYSTKYSIDLCNWISQWWKWKLHFSPTSCPKYSIISFKRMSMLIWYQWALKRNRCFRSCFRTSSNNCFNINWKCWINCFI